MSLDESRTDRNYLYGRMLAVADWVENSSYETWGERETNAVRYMNALSQKPYRTWAIIEKNLQPYFAKLNIWARKKYRNLLDEINDKFEAGDYESEKPLEGLYLHGYHCQLQFLRNQAAELKEQKKKNEETM